MRINYIKVNFVTTPPSSIFIKEHFTRYCNLQVGTFIQFKELKITLMGSKFEHVNVTGLRSLAYAKIFQRFYISVSNVKVISSIKIDSISATHKFENKSVISLEEFRRKLSILKLTAKDNSKFPGVCIRGEKSGGCAVYFRSGAINFIGFKHPFYMIKMEKKIESCLF